MMNYKKLKSLVAGRELPLAGTNVDGETVIIKRVDNALVASTYQHNGWICDRYYYEDGDTEEMYHK